jgi:site-specific DNA-methyltransferase (adenine-specific)
MSWRVIEADCVEAMREMDEVSVDAIVTDPPYGLEFMGKEWDRLGATVEKQSGDTPAWPNGSGVMVEGGSGPFGGGGQRIRYGSTVKAMQEWHQAWATEALRVLKPGGHLLAFGGTRTYHRLACAVEDAGFEIRDSVIWLYGSGFPKSFNLNGDHAGWGTALKPAHEPIVVARKPLVGTVAQNVERFGTGALNIDGCRIEGAVPQTTHGVSSRQGEVYGHFREEPEPSIVNAAGRWPANVALSCECPDDSHSEPPCPVAELDRQSGERVSGELRAGHKQGGGEGYGYGDGVIQRDYGGDSGGASRFFATFSDPDLGGGAHKVNERVSPTADVSARFRYVAKASRAERNAGLEGFEEQHPQERSSVSRHFEKAGSLSLARANVHPTVKPVDLMRWLCRLITPPDGTVLDPFAGSGTTGIACVLEDFDFIGIEREAEYVEIARGRIDYWARQPKQLSLEAA